MTKNSIDDSTKQQIYNEFVVLPLRDKLVIYSRLLHGNQIQIGPNDVLGLNKSLTNKIYTSFIKKIRTNLKSNPSQGIFNVDRES